LPRAMPVMSGMTHSTSWMRCWVKKASMALGVDMGVAGSGDGQILVCGHQFVITKIYMKLKSH